MATEGQGGKLEQTLFSQISETLPAPWSKIVSPLNLETTLCCLRTLSKQLKWTIKAHKALGYASCCFVSELLGSYFFIVFHGRATVSCIIIQALCGLIPMHSYLIAQAFVVTLPMSLQSSFGRIYTREDGLVKEKHSSIAIFKKKSRASFSIWVQNCAFYKLPYGMKMFRYTWVNKIKCWSLDSLGKAQTFPLK